MRCTQTCLFQMMQRVCCRLKQRVVLVLLCSSSYAHLLFLLSLSWSQLQFSLRWETFSCAVSFDDSARITSSRRRWIRRRNSARFIGDRSIGEQCTQSSNNYSGDRIPGSDLERLAVKCFARAASIPQNQFDKATACLVGCGTPRAG